jgi:hypothetical protein
MQPFPFMPWMWRDIFRDRVDDTANSHDRPDTGLIGYDVEATDGSIGKIDEDNARVPSDCLMVDTGPWIFGRKVVLPVGAVQRIDHEQRKVYVDRTKDQVKHAPEYDPDTGDSDTYRQRLGDYYTDSYRTFPPLL